MSAIHLTGQLDADARACRTQAGEHLLMISMALPGGQQGKPMTLRVTKHFGTGPAADIACKSRARTMRRGVAVMVIGTGMSWRRGYAELEGVSYLDTPDFQHHRGFNE